jgi:hypothetical protein
VFFIFEDIFKKDSKISLIHIKLYTETIKIQVKLHL